MPRVKFPIFSAEEKSCSFAGQCAIGPETGALEVWIHAELSLKLYSSAIGNGRVAVMVVNLQALKSAFLEPNMISTSVYNAIGVADVLQIISNGV